MAIRSQSGNLVRLVACGMLAGGMLAVAWPAKAAAPATPQAAGSSTADVQDAARLARQLDADKFVDREVASRKLLELGTRAIEAVERAATGDSREASQRAFEILDQLKGSSDPAARNAAIASLERLSSSDLQRVARRAQAALDPQEDKIAQAGPFAPRIQIAPQIIPAVPGAQGGFRIQGNIQIAAGNGKVQVIQVRNANGARSIKVTEGGKTIEIEDGGQQGITVKVTEKVGGKEKTSQYQAKDAAELKKKHPEAHKLYEKHAGKNAGIRIQVQPAQIQPRRIQRPKLVPQPKPAPPKDAETPAQKPGEKDLNQDGDARKQIQRTVEKLKQAQGDERQKALDELRKQIEALQKQQRKQPPK